MEIIWESIWDQNQRDKNEDAIGYRQYRYRKFICGIAVVSDGIGGMNQGEDASSYIVREMMRAMDELLQTGRFKKRYIRKFFFRKIYQTHSRLQHYGREQKIKLGATLSMVIFIGQRVFLFHLGDSSIYAGKRNLKLKTPRHLLNQKLCRAIGVEHYHCPFFKEIHWQKGMGILVCTDGFDKRTDEEMKILSSMSLEREMISNCLAKIANRAKELGEKDNISAIFIKRQK